MTLDTLLRNSAATLAETLGLPASEARIEAQILLGHALGKPRAWLIAHGDETAGEVPAFKALLQRRLQGEPVAYILGEREFFGLSFAVSPAVLIPRPETELLVELSLSRLPDRAPCRVLDLGTGSGAIAVTLARHRPQAEVVAVDASEAALQVAAANARRLNTPNVRLIRSDWYAALADETFDLIVSNPPYIAEADPHLAQGDLRFEPSQALASGADGLDAVRVIVQGSSRHLAAGGWLLFEHGYDQAVACRELLEGEGFRDVGSCGDLAGIERVTLGRRA